MRVIFAILLLFYTYHLSAQAFELEYAGRDSLFYREGNEVTAKKVLRHTTGSFLGTSKDMIGSGFISEMGAKQSKITAQLFGHLTSMSGDVLAANLKFAATTDDSFYGLNAMERPTFSFAVGVFLLLQPGKWRINEGEYADRAKNPSISFSNATALKTSYKWFHFSGGMDDGRLKLGKIKNTLFESYRGQIRTNNFGFNYNRLRVHNTDDYNLKGFKSTLFSFGVEWVKLSNYWNLPTYSANLERMALDTSGAATYLHQDLGNHYMPTPQSPFRHFYETVYKMSFAAETVSGWVLSTAINYHHPRWKEDVPQTLSLDGERGEYLGFEAGLHYSAKNKTGKSIANIGVYGDYNYSNLYHHWVLSLKTSFPIGYREI